jgi:uncharacterized protein YcbX
VELIVSGLHVYPVKSCRGVALLEARLGVRGLEWDREWMVVGEDGRFLTQREHPALAKVGVSLAPDALGLSAPGRATFRVPLEPGEAGRTMRAVEVWGHRCAALDEGDAVAAWWSAFVGAPVRLVRFDPRHRRLSSLEWTGGLEAENGFSDGYPLLVLSEESLEDLNARIAAAEGGRGREAGTAGGGSAAASAGGLLMNRFRPNLVVRGGGAGAEDRVRDLRRDGIHLRVVKPCARCRITTTDQDTAQVGAEPLRTLATYRRDARVGGVVFGQNTICIDGVGRVLRVGDVFVCD